MRGVFVTYTGKRMFVHRMWISLNGRVRYRRWRTLSVRKSVPTLGPDSFHARAAIGVNRLTGNEFQLMFGKFSKFPNVPDARLSLCSVKRPLTAAEIGHCAREFAGSVDAARLSYVEITFDLPTEDQRWVANQIYSRSPYRKVLVDADGFRTSYFGSRKSSKQIVVYQKTKNIVRVEVVLRRQGLHRLGLEMPDDLLRLRTLPLHRLVEMRRLRTSRIKEILRRQEKSEVTKQLWAYFAKRDPACQFAREFAKRYGAPYKSLLGDSVLQRTLRQMKKRFIF